MPFSPGVQDISGQIRAQGRVALAQGIGQGVSDFARNYAQSQEENAKFNAKSKAMENLVKTHAELFGLSDPEKLKQALDTNPRETPIAKYERLSSMVEGSVMASKMKQAEDARKSAEQQRQMQAMQMQAMQAEIQQKQTDQKAIADALRMLPQPTYQQSAAGEAVAQGGFGVDIQGMPTAATMRKAPPPDVAQIVQRMAAGGASPEAMARLQKTIEMFSPPKPAKLDVVKIGATVGGKPYEHTVDANTGEILGGREIGTPQRPVLTPEEEAAKASKVGAMNISIKRVENSLKSADEAAGQLNRLNRGIKLLEDPEVSSGFGTGALVKGKQVLDTFGIPSKGLAKTEELQSILGENMMSTILQQTKGAVSDREMTLFDSYSASLSKSKEGNMLILRAAKKVAERSLKEAALVRTLRRQGKNMDEIDMALDDFREKNTVFTPEEEAMISSTANLQPLKFDAVTVTR